MTTVLQAFGIRTETKGEIGVEIEVEGTSLPEMRAYWRNERDGSLAGPESREYVLSKPLDLDGVKKALAYMEKMWTANGTTIHDAVRAGVHIHINCQRLTLIQLFNFITAFLILENCLTKWCGPTREGNLFCLRSKDASYLVAQLVAATGNRKRMRQVFHTDMLRYAAMNVKALGDYGSLEFRALRSTRDLSVVMKWATILYNLREHILKYENPIQLIQEFSMDGGVEFAEKLLGDHAAEVFALYDTEAHLQHDLYEGMRNAQDVAYAVEDWAKWDNALKMVGGLAFHEDDDTNEPDEDF
jgi:hypothetical protein